MTNYEQDPQEYNPLEWNLKIKTPEELASELLRVREIRSQEQIYTLNELPVCTHGYQTVEELVSKIKISLKIEEPKKRQVEINADLVQIKPIEKNPLTSKIKKYREAVVLLSTKKLQQAIQDSTRNINPILNWFEETLKMRAQIAQFCMRNITHLKGTTADFKLYNAIIHNQFVNAGFSYEGLYKKRMQDEKAFLSPIAKSSSLISKRAERDALLTPKQQAAERIISDIIFACQPGYYKDLKEQIAHYRKMPDDSERQGIPNRFITRNLPRRASGENGSQGLSR